MSKLIEQRDRTNEVCDFRNFATDCIEVIKDFDFVLHSLEEGQVEYGITDEQLHYTSCMLDYAIECYNYFALSENEEAGKTVIQPIRRSEVR